MKRNFGLLWCGLMLCFALVSGPLAAQEKPVEPKPHPAHRLLAQMQDELSDVADQILPTVVTVFSVKPGVRVENGSIGGDEDNYVDRWPQGSGFIINSKGWILTNNHVVAGSDRILVRLKDGRQFVGVVYPDPHSDLALIKIPAENLPFAALGDSDTVKVGHWAIAIGSPYHHEGTFALGIISSLARRQTIREYVYPNMIQTDAAINSGNSGGPLCNLDGHVIGINTAIEKDKGASVGIGFAIPINSAQFVIKELMEKGVVHYGYLGVFSMTDPKGALIKKEPELDTPAEKAGIHAGDIIAEVNGTPIHNEADLQRVVGQARPQTNLVIKLLRKGESVRLSARVAVDTQPNISAKPRAIKNRIGLTVETLTDELAKKNHIAKCPGVLISGIDPYSEAQTINEITEGIVIVRVNDTDTPTIEAYNAVINALKPGSMVTLLCQIEKTQQAFLLPVD